MEARAKDNKKIGIDSAHATQDILRSLPHDLLRYFLANYPKLHGLLQLRRTCRYFRDHPGIKEGINRELKDGFHTLLIPSPSHITDRTKTGNYAAEVDVFMTQDSKRLSCKLMLIFEFTNLDMAQARLGNKLNELRDFLVHIVKAGVAKKISSTHSMYFRGETNHQQLFAGVVEKLKRDFSEYGIRLVSLTIERVKTLELGLESNTAQFSLKNPGRSQTFFNKPVSPGTLPQDLQEYNQSLKQLAVALLREAKKEVEQARRFQCG